MPFKAAAPTEVNVLPRPRFKPPLLVMFNEATVLAKPEASSVPPLMVTAELAKGRWPRRPRALPA